MNEVAQAKAIVEQNGLHLMRPDDVRMFIDCAVESYGNISYPLMDWFMGRPCTKNDLREMWLLNMKFFADKALIYSDSRQCNGWALWVPPGFGGVSAFQFILSGGLSMAKKLGVSSLMRMIHYENYCGESRLTAARGKEWYMYNLVILPESQGKHIASKLLLPMLDFAASEGRPVYLETHSPKNVEIYKHFGFRTVSDKCIPGTDVKHWGMLK